jgi:phosphoserine phosphatase
MNAEDHGEVQRRMLTPRIGESLHRDLFNVERILSDVRYAEGALDVLMRPALNVTRSIFVSHGLTAPSDNLYGCIEALHAKSLIPDEIASYLHFIRTLSNKPHHGAESVRLQISDADNAYRALLRVVEWHFCESESGPHLDSIYGGSGAAEEGSGDRKPLEQTSSSGLDSRGQPRQSEPLTDAERAEVLRSYAEQLVAEMNNNLVLELCERPYYEDICIAPALFLVEPTTGRLAPVDIGHVAASRRAVILGEPGSGKTTALRSLALSLIREKPAPVVPVYVALASFGLSWIEKGVGAFRLFLDSELRLLGCSSLSELQGAARRECLLLLDGWDELPSERACALVKQFLLSAQLPFVISARPEVQRTLPLAARYEMAQLSPDRIHEFTQLRIRDDAVLRGFQNWLTSEPSLSRLARNPLNLSIMTIAYMDRPDDARLTKTALYERAFEAILRQHHRDMNRDGDDPAAHDELFDAERVLQEIAYSTMRSGEGRFFSQRQLNQAIAKVLGQIPAGFPGQLVGRLGVIRDRRAGRLEFFHLWYQEFLAARELVEGAHDMVSELSLPALTPALPFVVGLLRDQDRIFDLLLRIRIHDSFSYCRSISEADLETERVGKLLRRAVVNAEQSDPRPPVRVELAPALAEAGLGAAGGLKEILFDADLSEYARRAALEALALLPIRDGTLNDALLRLLADSSHGILYHIIELVGRRRLAAARQVLETYRADADPIVAGDALWALMQLGVAGAADFSEEQMALLMERLYSEDRHVQGHALRTIGRLRVDRALPRLEAYLTRQDAAYRWIAAEAAGLIGGRDSLGVLTAGIYDTDPRVVAASLQGLVDCGECGSAQLLEKIRQLRENPTWIVFREETLGGCAAATFSLLVEREKAKNLARLLVTRHCATEWNAEGRLQGTVDLPLSEAGVSEARSFALWLRGWSVSRVVASPAQRASQTGEIVAHTLGVPFEVHPGLRELDHGRWEGRRFQDLLEDPVTGYAAWLRRPDLIPIPGGRESAGMAQQRIVEAIRSVALDHPGETVLLVSHKHIRALLRCWLHGLGLERFQDGIDDSTLPEEIPRETVQRICQAVQQAHEEVPSPEQARGESGAGEGAES